MCIFMSSIRETDMREGKSKRNEKNQKDILYLLGNEYRIKLELNPQHN